MRRLLPLLMLVGCASHVNGCEGNDAVRYALFLDEKAHCWSLKYGNSGEDDYAICQVSEETWLCQGDGHCWPLGPAVLVRRVK